MSRRRFYAMAVLIVLLIAGGASYYASSHPDGLEFVAEKTGFIDKAEDAKLESPLPNYTTPGVDNERASGALAGVAGVLLVGSLGGGLFWILRRRTDDEAVDDDRGVKVDV